MIHRIMDMDTTWCGLDASGMLNSQWHDVNCLKCCETVANSNAYGMGPIAKQRWYALMMGISHLLSNAEPERVTEYVTRDNPAHVALLLRLSDFLANLPPGALDRTRNIEMMSLRRAVADLVVPADKPKK